MNSTNALQQLTIASRDQQTKAIIVPQRGGIVSSWTVEGERELLFRHPYFWDKDIEDLPGGIPLCFPNCGRLEHDGQMGCYQHAGKLYHMPIHGLAWWLPWSVALHHQDRIHLQLVSNPSTKALYPFDFCVQLNYHITHNTLTCEQTYHNTGTETMPYTAGFHPYFLTPPCNSGKDRVSIEFTATQRYVYNESLTDVISTTEVLALPASITDPQINEQLSLMELQHPVLLHYPEEHRITLNANALASNNLFSHLQLYTAPKLPFFCAEPWMAPPNALNHKKHLRLLKPGHTDHGKLTLQWQ